MAAVAALGQALSCVEAQAIVISPQPLDRWRLILGRDRGQLRGQAGRAARALDELYGNGHGGRSAALLELDPESVVPSVELLQRALAFQSGLARAGLERLRRLVERVVRALVEELSRNLRPALSGLTVSRATRRSTGLLDLARTMRANLHTVRPGAGIVPERLLFRSRARRSLDWRVVLVVDVSSSMEASSILSAMMAATLAGLPAVSVHFLAFSTEVIDFSERLSDPLGLLMEVQVDGGTRIPPALAYPRGLMTVPTRTLVMDFEDADPLDSVLSEVRALVESRCRPLGLAALFDDGAPRYSVNTAEAVVAAGMPIAAPTPLELARWVGDQLRTFRSPIANPLEQE